MSARTDASCGAGPQVLAVGCGVGGLALAAFLDARDTGAGAVVAGPVGPHGRDGPVTLWPGALALLDRLGLAADARSVGTELGRFCRRLPSGSVVERRCATTGADPVVLERDRLRGLLRDRLPPGVVRLTKTPRTVDRRNRTPVVEFEDGVREPFDAVVAADGPDSWLRSSVPDAAVRRPGTSTWWFRCEPVLDRRDTVAEVVDERSLVALRPVDGADIGRVVTTGDRDRETVRAAVTAALAGGFGAADSSLERLRGRTDTVLQPGSRVVDGDCIALLGAAAPSVLPGLGLGPSLALADAAVLAEELASRSGRETGTGTALQQYERRRTDRLARLERRLSAGLRGSEEQTGSLERVATCRSALFGAAFDGDPAFSTGTTDC